MPDRVVPIRPPASDPVDRARDLIAAVLSRDEELQLGIGVFDLWAAFDELVEPTNPPPPPIPVWFDDPALALRAAYRDLVTAIDRAPDFASALALGRAARGVAVAMAEIDEPA